MAGHFERAGVAPHRVLREFRIEDSSAHPVGSSVDVSLFEVGEKVDVVGVSKGRGFAGPMKRHHSSRGPETHGSMYHRRVGSMGASADPSRVRKGKPGAGRMGAERVTVQNLRVVKVDPERHLIVLKGATPGFNNGYVTIAKSVKAKKKAAS
jgi:large subunit ribosomal protein L3